MHCPTPRCDFFLSVKGSEDSRLKRRGLLVANDWKPERYIEEKKQKKHTAFCKYNKKFYKFSSSIDDNNSVGVTLRMV